MALEALGIPAASPLSGLGLYLCGAGKSTPRRIRILEDTVWNRGCSAVQRECYQNPTQLEALVVMLRVTTAYFCLPFLCLGVFYGLIRHEPSRGRERSRRQTGRLLSK